MKKMGRPLKNGLDAKDSPLSVKLDFSAKIKLEQLAEHFDISKSECIRKLIEDRFEIERFYMDE